MISVPNKGLSIDQCLPNSVIISVGERNSYGATVVAQCDRSHLTIDESLWQAAKIDRRNVWTSSDFRSVRFDVRHARMQSTIWTFNWRRMWIAATGEGKDASDETNCEDEKETTTWIRVGALRTTFTHYFCSCKMHRFFLCPFFPLQSKWKSREKRKHIRTWQTKLVWNRTAQVNKIHT